MRRQFAVAVVLLTLHANMAAAREPINLHWGDLGARVNGRQVSLVLPGGVHVSGKAHGVEPEGLRMKVRKTSDRKAQPKGEHVIPRASISTLQLTEYGVKWRITGALAAPAAAVGIAAGTAPRDLEGSLVIIIPALTAAAAVGTAVAGYFIGKRADKRVTDIRIVK